MPQASYTNNSMSGSLPGKGGCWKHGCADLLSATDQWEAAQGRYQGPLEDIFDPDETLLSSGSLAQSELKKKKSVYSQQVSGDAMGAILSQTYFQYKPSRYWKG